MTTITLPPDLEGRITQEADRLGTTTEILAIKKLSELFKPLSTTQNKANCRSMLEYVSDHIGTIAGSSEPYSQNTGKRFAEILADKAQKGQK
jgi:hypothetical protein